MGRGLGVIAIRFVLVCEVRAKALRAIALAVGAALVVVACGSESQSVASVGDTSAGSDGDANAPVEDDGTVDAEAAWMAWAQCLRDNGLEVEDPVVDPDGNVQKPEIIRPVSEADSKEKASVAGAECDAPLEGVTASFEEKDGVSPEDGDALLELAGCLRGEGIDVDDPDMSSESPAAAMFADLKPRWASPRIQAALEACDFEAVFGNRGTK